MKLVTTPVAMVASFDKKGDIRPLKFRYQGQIITIEQVISKEKKHIAGGNFVNFHCSTSENLMQRFFQLTFDANTYSWILVKID